MNADEIDLEEDLTEREHDLLDAIIELAEELGWTPSTDDMRREGEHTPELYYQYFRMLDDVSWENILRLAHRKAPDSIDLGNRRGQGRNPVPKEKLLEDIRKVAAELGRPPTSTEHKEYGHHGVASIFRRFETWGNALEEAGFDPDNRKNSTGDSGEDGENGKNENAVQA